MTETGTEAARLLAQAPAARPFASKHRIPCKATSLIPPLTVPSDTSHGDRPANIRDGMRLDPPPDPEMSVKLFQGLGECVGLPAFDDPEKWIGLHEAFARLGGRQIRGAAVFIRCSLGYTGPSAAVVSSKRCRQHQEGQEEEIVSSCVFICCSYQGAFVFLSDTSMFGEMEKLHSNHPDIVHSTCFEGTWDVYLVFCSPSLRANYLDRVAVQFHDEGEGRPKPIREGDVYYRGSFDVFTESVKVCTCFAIASSGRMLTMPFLSSSTRMRAFVASRTSLAMEQVPCTSVLSASEPTMPGAFVVDSRRTMVL